MKIGIVGSGLMGGKLGVLWAKSGHQITFSYSRQQDKLVQLARRAGNGAKAGTVEDAAHAADVIFLAVHWSRLTDALHQIGDLYGRTVVSCCVPLNLSNSELIIGRTDSGAEQLSRLMAGAKLAAAFQTTPSEAFDDVFALRNTDRRPSCVYCGDDKDAKAVAAQMISDIGYEPVDAGALRIARYIEPFAMLTAQLAYTTDQGPNWAYRCSSIHHLL